MVEKEPQPTIVSIRCEDCSWGHNIKASGNSSLECAMEFANSVARIHQEQFDHNVKVSIGK